MYAEQELQKALELWRCQTLHIDPDRFRALVKSIPVYDKTDSLWGKRIPKGEYLAEKFREAHCGAMHLNSVWLQMYLKAFPNLKQEDRRPVRYMSTGMFRPVYLPRKDPMSDRIRACLTPPKGFRWIATTWERVEFWAIANLTRDPAFVEFAKQDDPFSWLVAKSGGSPELTPENRRLLKEHVYTALYRRSSEFPGLFEGVYDFRHGIASPYKRDPFGKPFPDYFQPSFGFVCMLVEMALVEAYRKRQLLGCRLVHLDPDTFVGQVPEENSDLFVEFAKECFHFKEVERRMEWVLPLKTHVREIQDFRGI